jgi:hypothetical protein
MSDTKLSDTDFAKIMSIATRMEKAVADEDNLWLVILAAASLAGHIINCCCVEENKNSKASDIRQAIKALRYTANMDIQEAKRQYMMQTIQPVGSA